MIKMAVFCPRLPRESEGAWQLRVQACRLYLRQLHNVETHTFDTLEHLQIKYRKHSYRLVLVAHSGCYSAAFRGWADAHQVTVLDVLLRPEPPAAETALAGAEAGPRYALTAPRRETPYEDSASE